MPERVHPEESVPAEDGPEQAPKGGAGCRVVVLSHGDAEAGTGPTLQIRTGHAGSPYKTYEVCRNSLCCIPYTWTARQMVLALVEWKWFDRFILLNIAAISVLSAFYEWRAPSDTGFNGVKDRIVEPIINSFFTVEFVLKVVAWGLIWPRGAYLRSPWNWLDFIVVLDFLLSRFLTMSSGLTILRLFRALRPLRSLNAVPEMKQLVNTILVSIPKLGNVTLMGLFLYMIFAIIGITLYSGVFYHRCRLTENPELMLMSDNVTRCWAWEYADTERLCGGGYACPGDTYCGGHEEDQSASLRPKFPGGKQGYDWCAGSEPLKLFPETDFIHFDHLGGAILIVFQCMTLEGWTDIMYWVQDSHNAIVATIYFFAMICVTSHFLLNVVLAVVDETRDNFDDEEFKLPDKETEKTDADEPEKLWLDCAPVRFLHMITTSEIFLNLVLFAIIGNVITMCLDKYPPEVSWKAFLEVTEITFLVIFCIEMVLMLGAVGPIKYAMNPVTAFDGIVVVVSVVQKCTGISGPFTALRMLRLIRVLNKLQDRWHSLKVLLKAIVHTLRALNYWAVLFFLVLYIFTLIFQTFFSTKFHFNDPDAFDAIVGEPDSLWCPDKDSLPPGQQSWHYWQDCIPRAHFDTFLWAFVAIFQIMTGENWNTVMYAGMRATGWWSCVLFWIAIIFGQGVFLSVFLSILTSKFQLVKEEIAKQQGKKKKAGNSLIKSKSVSKLIEIKRRLSHSSFSSKDNDVEDDKIAQGPGRTNTAKWSPMEDNSTKRVDVKPKPATDNTLPGQVEHGSCDAKRIDEDDGHTRVEPLTLPPSGQGSGEAPSGVAVNDPPTEKGQASVANWLLPAKEAKKKWPHGYAWFVLSEANPLRRAARWILRASVRIRGDDVKIFDNFILLCILLSTVCMMVDSPRQDPQATLTRVVRAADYGFAIVFIVEFAVKLTALGLVWGPDAYLKSGWNWLDGIVVIISIINMASEGSGGFLKTMRILRAFRPLRVISRNENLKVVVQTIFASVPDLATLLVVIFLFLLISALIALSYLKGEFYACPTPSDPRDMPALDRDIPDLTTPLCVQDTLPNATFPIGTANDGVARQDGKWNHTTNTWQPGGCPSETHSWMRATVDTPICIGRCDPWETTEHLPPTWLCPRKFNSTEELPPVGKCRTSKTWTEAELRGETFVVAMKRALVMPCGGSAVEGNSVNPVAASAASCREVFCPEATISNDKRTSCKSNCRKHPDFCIDACKNQLRGEDSLLTPGCASCLHECEAQCECNDFCEPLIKDAALCHEQGQTWSAGLSQNFNNIWSSLLTLFEISTTEGWVDVMYWASDQSGIYVQPIRDNQRLWAPFFVMYIFFMTMFLINLSVGIIVERFIDLKNDGGRPLMTKSQEQWVRSKMTLYNTRVFFPITNLQRLPSLQRQIYELVSHKYFDRFIMVAICLNTLLMSLKTFPSPTVWWSDLLNVFNVMFFAVFLIEAILKIFALRRNYFRDNWNVFDFVCVMAGMISYFVRLVSKTDIVAVSGVVRIFRIARLFRIMRSFKEVNKIFMALLLSLPKLANVMAILVLVLILYSILGVSLFSMAKKPSDGTLDDHGNFDNFPQAFVTLFRASTGEAWNELMHDLAKDEYTYFRDGDWCSPSDLFDPAGKYSVLNDKCLMDEPNACVQGLFGQNILPYIYWVTYILVCLHLMMNLVIAVILDGYEEGRQMPPEETVLDLCIERWKKYDPDITERVPLPKAMSFITEVYSEICRREQQKQEAHAYYFKDNSTHNDVTVMPMQFANCLDLQLSQDGQVSFTSASRQVLRLAVLSGKQENIMAIEGGEHLLDAKTATKLKQLEQRSKEGPGEDLKTIVAATKLQRRFRQMKAARAMAASRTVGAACATTDGGTEAGCSGKAVSSADIPKDVPAEGMANVRAQGEHIIPPPRPENLPWPREAG